MTDSQKKQDLAALAHDVRQMLAVISGRTSLLLERDLPAEWRRHLEAVSLAAEDAALMLKRLAAEGAGPREAGSGGLLGEVVKQSLLLVMEEEAGAGRWTWTVEVPAHLRTEVPDQVLREVLNNLLINAREASPEGGELAVTAELREGSIALTVADDGPGVPEEIRQRIFTSPVSTKEGSGRGLGLASCRALLQNHGGDLRSGEGSLAGACFVLELPACAVAGDLPRKEGSAGIDEAGAFTGEVLVVDDDATVVEMLEDVLLALGHRAASVGDYDRALELFQPGRFGLALIDQSLPGRSGLELAKELRERDENIVLVLVTGWGNEDIVANARQHGCDLAAEKPLTVGKIRQILARAGAGKAPDSGDKDRL